MRIVQWTFWFIGWLIGLACRPFGMVETACEVCEGKASRLRVRPISLPVFCSPECLEKWQTDRLNKAIGQE